MSLSLWIRACNHEACVERQADPGRYASYAKLRALLVLASEEVPDAPLYYNLHDLSKTIRVTAPPADAFRSALVNAGACFVFWVCLGSSMSTFVLHMVCALA